jgi:alpha/beta superfamily hydrolase
MITATSRSFPFPVPVRSASAARVRSIDLHGPAGRLEAVLNEGSPHAAFAAVSAHPHPLGGGSLHNKVVYHAMKVMNASEWGFNFPVLRFNFRGTGLSEGVYDGAAEAGDVLAALAWIENEYKLPVAAAGFSFGAAMALKACCAGTSLRGLKRETCGAPDRELDMRALVAIGLPMRSGTSPVQLPSYDYSFVSRCTIPKLFLSGDRDQFATKAEFIEAVALAAEPKKMALVPGADHFFTGHLKRMQSTLAGWLKEQLS